MTRILEDSHGVYVKRDFGVYRPQWSAFTSPYCLNPKWRKGMKSKFKHTPLDSETYSQVLVAKREHQAETSFHLGDQVKIDCIAHTGDCYISAEGHDLEMWHKHYAATAGVPSVSNTSEDCWLPMEAWLKVLEERRKEGK